MKTHRLFMTLATLLGSITAANATIVGFFGIGGNNAGIPGTYASNVTADGTGWTISNGATPNIALGWDPNAQVHHSSFFNPLENLTLGGSWDTDGTQPSIGQLDFGTYNLTFNVDAGYALVLNSFDFGHTAETAGTTQWSLTLSAVSTSTIVWSQNVTFTNGQSFTFSPNFTGTNGEDYLLTFTRTSQTYNSDGRHGIDNLSFAQVAVPEPSTYGLAFAVMLLGAITFARRRKALNA